MAKKSYTLSKVKFLFIVEIIKTLFNEDSHIHKKHTISNGVDSRPWLTAHIIVKLFYVTGSIFNKAQNWNVGQIDQN